MKRRKEAALRDGIMRQVNAQVRAAAKPGEPDAWMRLVLSGMPAAELRREIAQPEGKSADELRWLREELARRPKTETK
jgi:hypothetical protein